MSARARLSAALVLCALMSLGACSRDASQASRADQAGQVIARVNGEEITIHQLNAEAASVPMTGEDAKDVRKQVLRSIVYRTMLRQAAVKAKLDRNPNVRMLIDAAKDRVLAELYVDSQTGTTPPPTSDEIEKFITDNPLQFNERRIYTFEQLTLDAGKYASSMVALFDQKESFDQLRGYLDGKGITYQTAEVRLASTDFPKEVKDQLIKFGVGDNVVVRGTDTIAILKIKSWVEMPVDSSQAEQAAANTLHDQAIEARDATLRDQLLHGSKVEFLGDFAGTAMNDKDSAEPAASAKRTAGPAGNTAASAMDDPGSNDIDEGEQ